MKIIINWDKDPEIRWQKKICPICHEQTGPTSRCYELRTSALSNVDEKDNEESFLNKTIEHKDEVYPILSEQCLFRRLNQYYINVNFPISKPMVQVIGEIEGIDELVVMSPYLFQLTIANLFDEKQVKRQIEKRYNEFIKSQKEKIQE